MRLALRRCLAGCAQEAQDAALIAACYVSATSVSRRLAPTRPIFRVSARHDAALPAVWPQFCARQNDRLLALFATDLPLRHDWVYEVLLFPTHFQALAIPLPSPQPHYTSALQPSPLFLINTPCPVRIRSTIHFAVYLTFSDAPAAALSPPSSVNLRRSAFGFSSTQRLHSPKTTQQHHPLESPSSWIASAKILHPSCITPRNNTTSSIPFMPHIRTTPAGQGVRPVRQLRIRSTTITTSTSSR